MNIRKQRKKARKRIRNWVRSGSNLKDPTGHQFDLCDQWEWRRGWYKRQGRFSS